MDTQTLNEYRELLRTHDWQSEYSDDHGAFTRGRARLSALQLLRKQIDPDASVWNSIAPVTHHIKHAEAV